jgi:hypothetical protein
MIGMLVKVYTTTISSTNTRSPRSFLHQLTLDAPLNATSEQLWLRRPKARLGRPARRRYGQAIESLPADHKDAHPTPPVVCG